MRGSYPAAARSPTHKVGHAQNDDEGHESEDDYQRSAPGAVVAVALHGEHCVMGLTALTEFWNLKK